MARILIVGAGAIGGLLATRLARAGHDLTLVGRPWLQEAVARDGLRLQLGDELLVTRAAVVHTALTDALAADPYDWLFLTPRFHALPALLAELNAWNGPLPPLVTFQNGVGSEALTAEAVGADRVVAASITTPVEVIGPAHLASHDKGGIALAAWDPNGGPPVQPLLDTLQSAGFRARQCDDAASMKWSKLLLNMIGNASSALLGWPPAQTLADPRLYRVEIGALREADAVMQALGLKLTSLPGYPVRPQMTALFALPLWLTRPIMQRMVAGGRGGKMPSLYLALEAGQEQSEVSVLNGAVAAQGEALGIATPLNDALTRLVLALAERRLPRDTFRDDPAALLAALRR
ncbi:MAG: 2-dehydropantoate 2-reductase [Ardenticatenales bacterium]|nr:2-dehydropantoate 2-reductase [Ardenticatenales bacterium]